MANNINKYFFQFYLLLFVIVVIIILSLNKYYLCKTVID